MRWIFCVLVCLNGFLFAWYAVSAGEGKAISVVELNQPQTPDAANIESLTMVSEAVGVNHLKLPESGASKPKEKKPICTSVGPFKTLDRAEELKARLSAIEVRSSVSEIELPGGESYWVYLPSEGGRADARRKLAELQALKVDSYIIPKGDLANGISLGVFSRSVLAQRRMAAMKELGLSPKLHTSEKTITEIWLYLEAGEEQKLDASWWRSLVNEEFRLEERQNFCLAVASQEKFH